MGNQATKARRQGNTENNSSAEHEQNVAGQNEPQQSDSSSGESAKQRKSNKTKRRSSRNLDQSNNFQTPPHVDTAAVASAAPAHQQHSKQQQGALVTQNHRTSVSERPLHGSELLQNPHANLATGFSEQDRDRLGLRGLLPPKTEVSSRMVQRVMRQIRNLDRPLNKYLVLERIRLTHEQLFYRVLLDNLRELLPIVYTPTVGEACLSFDNVASMGASSGMWFSFSDSGRMRRMLDNCSLRDVELVVVTDGGRILGLGDLGANGMGIPVGKTALYCAAGGFNPKRTLPVQLDLGTDNPDLLSDPLYLGHHTPRLKGSEHLRIVEEFCDAISHKFPNALVQFEDFQTSQAFDILERMRDRMLCFNDDIQGTGAVVLSGLINGLRQQGINFSEARIVFFGAGSSAVGVASMIAGLLMQEGQLEADIAKSKIYLVDSKGIITDHRGDKLPVHKSRFAHGEECPNLRSLRDIIEYVKPHALFGLSGNGPSFKQEDVEEMCKYVETPIIFPLSNPTSKAEITAEQAVHWSEGKCIFAAGSPFDPVEYNGTTIRPGQSNNALIFPGLGFGVASVGCTHIPDELFLTAAKALADTVSKEELASGQLYPFIENIRDVSLEVATATAEAAYEIGIATKYPKPGSMRQFLQERRFEPRPSNC